VHCADWVAIACASTWIVGALADGVAPFGRGGALWRRVETYVNLMKVFPRSRRQCQPSVGRRPRWDFLTDVNDDGMFGLTDVILRLRFRIGRTADG
jgi:hypothetical protein